MNNFAGGWPKTMELEGRRVSFRRISGRLPRWSGIVVLIGEIMEGFRRVTGVYGVRSGSLVVGRERREKKKGGCMWSLGKKGVARRVWRLPVFLDGVLVVKRASEKEREEMVRV
ncbi:hypothetical protein HAX54_052412 [Datura stramonium]|uniref:Uncharacterized protein n=1 Tax=Datura stramonium TaxID=4076 RepID=A0ABS8RTV8_DATST|nr:hypothetical protein [Datura stramonium]